MLNLFSPENLRIMLIRLPIILLIAIPVHEFAHAYVAYLLGDNTAKHQGRLTLNPFAHLDPIGVIAMMIFGFGWARPVPINPMNLKKGPKAFSLVGLAGPISNIIVAFLFLLIWGIINIFNPITNNTVVLIFQIGIYLNIGLAIFNLIPVPPLDGFNIIAAFLPYKVYEWFIRYGNILSIILIVSLYMGFLNNFLFSMQEGIFQILSHSVQWIVDLLSKVL